MTSYSTILVSRDTENASVAILTLNRPEAMNSFNTNMFRDLQTRLQAELDMDPSVRVIVVTGAGRAFLCGGRYFRRVWLGGIIDEGPSMHEGVVPR